MNTGTINRRNEMHRSLARYLAADERVERSWKSKKPIVMKVAPPTPICPRCNVGKYFVPETECWRCHIVLHPECRVDGVKFKDNMLCVCE
jgi:hypothetical protein